MLRFWVGILSLVAMAAVASEAGAEIAIPEAKQTVLGKYLSAKEAYDAVATERQKLLFLDVRTEAELMFVGMTGEVDVQLSRP